MANDTTATLAATDENLSAEDLFMSALKTLRVEHSLILKENAQLKTQLYDTQTENSDLKSELKETRALLGEAVVSASNLRKNLTPVPNQSNAPVAGPSRQPETTQKRARSLSVEIIDEPQKKAEGKKPQSQACSVSAPVVSAETHKKSHYRSYPAPTEAKRRRIDQEQKSSTDPCSSSSRSAPAKKPPTSLVPKKEVKPKVLVPAAILQTYLSSSPPLPISPPPLLDLHVPRRFLRLAYGGSDQQFLQTIKETQNPSGPTKRRIVFPMLDMNPVMPVKPGHAGLVFASRHEILWNGPWTVFCKPPETGKALWLYLGEYKSVLCGKMTKEQFGIQRDVVKKEWAKLLLRMKQFDVYVAMRARIALRKVGVLPVADPDEEEGLVNAEMDKIKAKQGTEVTEDDIIKALNRGDESIDIIRMTCVKYDHVFADDMKAQFPNYGKMLESDRARRKKLLGVEEDGGEEDGGEGSCGMRSGLRVRRKGLRLRRKGLMAVLMARGKGKRRECDESDDVDDVDEVCCDDDGDNDDDGSGDYVDNA